MDTVGEYNVPQNSAVHAISVAEKKAGHLADVTYVRLRGGWMYLVAVLDFFSRYIMSWELDQTLAQPFVMVAVQRALECATPVIWFR
jgi:transposase InsO family protein